MLKLTTGSISNCFTLTTAGGQFESLQGVSVHQPAFRYTSVHYSTLMVWRCDGDTPIKLYSGEHLKCSKLDWHKRSLFCPVATPSFKTGFSKGLLLNEPRCEKTGFFVYDVTHEVHTILK